MALPDSGPLKLTDIQTEFGGTDPIGLSEYYAGAGLVPAGTTGTYGVVPSSGQISILNFYGTSNAPPIPGIDWTNRPGFTSVFGSTNTVYAITWSPTLSLFVAVGGSNAGVSRCATSPDGITWTLQSNFSTAMGSSLATAVIWSGTKFISVGGRAIGQTRRCVTSPDGITWTNQAGFTSVWGSLDGPEAIAWSGLLFVVVGGSKCVTSSDGISWTDRPNFTNAFDPGGNGSAYSVTWAASINLFVAVGLNRTLNQGRCVTSSNGISWSNQISFSNTFGSNTPAYSVAWSESLYPVQGYALFFAVGSGGRGAISSDGISWTQISDFTTAISNYTAFSIIWTVLDPYYGTGQFVAVGSGGASPNFQGKCVTSPDGFVWTNQPNFTTALGSPAVPRTVAFNGSRLVSSGNNAKCVTSP